MERDCHELVDGKGEDLETVSLYNCQHEYGSRDKG